MSPNALKAVNIFFMVAFVAVLLLIIWLTARRQPAQTATRAEKEAYQEWVGRFLKFALPAYLFVFGVIAVAMLIVRGINYHLTGKT